MNTKRQRKREGKKRERIIFIRKVHYEMRDIIRREAALYLADILPSIIVKTVERQYPAMTGLGPVELATAAYVHFTQNSLPGLMTAAEKELVSRVLKYRSFKQE